MNRIWKETTRPPRDVDPHAHTEGRWFAGVPLPWVSVGVTARVQTALTNEEDLTRFILSQPHKMRHLSKT